MFLRALVLFWSLCCWGALVVNGNQDGYSLQLVGGDSRCRGQLRVQNSGPYSVWESGWMGVKTWKIPLWLGQKVCAELDCGSILTIEEKRVPEMRSALLYFDECQERSLFDCFTTESYPSDVQWQLNCSDSVQLVSGQTSCSGSLQIRDQSSDRSWTSVCEGALDRRGAEVLCREVGCGAPLLQGELSPLGQTFHCEGNESALMDCPRNQTRTDPGTCPTLNHTCSEPVRLVGGASRCEGMVEVELWAQWKRMTTNDFWDLEAAAVVCRDLDCGSAVFTERRAVSHSRDVCKVNARCVKKSSVRDCAFRDESDRDQGLWVMCSDSVRLVSGRSLCSGSLQIQDQSLDRSWTSVCEGALDRRGAEVLCRELRCGAPLLQGELSPLGQTFHCEGHESSLMDCPRNQTRTDPGTCPSLNLTCSAPVRLVGGASRCNGTLEAEFRGEWRRVGTPRWDPWHLESAASVCRSLYCGSAVSTEQREKLQSSDVWVVSSYCVRSSPLRECVIFGESDRDRGVEVVCSGEV